MKRRILLISTVLMFTALGAARVAESANLRIAAVSVNGSVFAKSPSGDWKTLKSKEALDVGDTVRTGKDGSVILSWSDGNIVKIAPVSIVVVDEASKEGEKENTSFNISSGKMFAKAKKLSTVDSSFKVKTPTAVAGVRGTEIAVGIVGNVSEFKVVEGSIAVEMPNQEPVILDQSFQIKISETMTEPPAPERIPDVELKELKETMNEVKSEAAQAETSSKDAKKDEKEASKELKKDDKEASKESKETGKEAQEGNEAAELKTETIDDDAVDSVNKNMENLTQTDIIEQAAQDAALEAGTGGIKGTIQF